MWNPYKQEQSAKKRLYWYYAIGLYCMGGIPPSLGELLHAWRNRKNMGLFIYHFTLVAAMLSSTGKIFNMWWRRLDLEITADLLNWERRQPCNREFGNFREVTIRISVRDQYAIYRDEIIISTIRTCQLFSWTYIVMVLWYCSFSYANVFFYSHEDMEKLSSSPLWFFRSNESTSYWLYFVIDKTAISYVAGGIVCHDVLFTVFLIHVGAQLDLLKRRLQWCYQDKNRARDDDVDDFTTTEQCDELNDLKVETVCRSIIEELSLNCIVELHTCIQHHQAILRCANLVQSIFNDTLLVQFVVSLLIITMSGFQICGGRKLSQNELIDSTNFLTCALFQLFLYCWFGANIISKSETISFSGYYSKWYEANVQYKQSLSIILQRGQIPIVFRAGYICELSSQTFMNIISKCYSCMALLNQVNE